VEFRCSRQGERLGNLLAGTGAGMGAELILFIANRRNRGAGKLRHDPPTFRNRAGLVEVVWIPEAHPAVFQRQDISGEPSTA